jgi:hypothetical protein
MQPLFSQSVNLKTAIAVIKNRPCFDPSAGSGSARTVFATLAKLVSNPFALSAAASVAIEGIRAFQLPFLG